MMTIEKKSGRLYGLLYLYRDEHAYITCGFVEGKPDVIVVVVEKPPNDTFREIVTREAAPYAVEFLTISRREQPKSAAAA